MNMRLLQDVLGLFVKTIIFWIGLSGWDERRFHIVPAYRGFNLSGTNLAESGQSGMKPKTRKKMKLVDAAYKDVSAMMHQDEQYRAYIGNISKEIGRGLNIRQTDTQNVEIFRERRSQELRAKCYAQALLSGDVNVQTDDEDEDKIFLLSLPTEQGTDHQR